MKINRIKLNKIITVVCAALVAFTTIIYTAIPASAESWTDWASAPAAAQQLAQAYYEAWSTNEDKSVANYFSDWADIPISWLKASTAVSSGYILSPADDIIYYLDESNLLYKDVTRAGGGGRSRVGSSSDIELDGETFADIVARLNEQYMPYEADTITMLTDNRWSDDTLAGKNSWYRMSLYTEGYYAGNSNWTEIYMQPFYFDGSDYWVSSSQIHLYQEVSQDDSGNNVITMKHEEYSMFDSFDIEGNVTEPIYHGTVDVINQSGIAIDFADYRYLDIWMNFNEYANQIKLSYYGSYSDYVAKATNQYNIAQICYASSIQNDVAVVRKVSDLEVGNFDNYVKLETLLANQYLNSTHANYVEGADIGFFVSNSIIKNGTVIIPDKIDPNATIAFGGDNVYEYTIINESGDSTTINEYITNNYTIIVGGSGDGEGDTTINNWDISFGDFVLEIGTTIETSIKNSFNFLFVPDDDFMDDKMGELKTNFEAKLPVFADLPDIFSELFVEMDENGEILRASVEKDNLDYYPQGDPVISDDYAEDVYPKWEFTIEFFGKEMTLVMLDLEVFKDVLPHVRLMILVFVYVVYIYNFVHYLPTLIGNLVSMGGTVNAIADMPEPNPYVKVNQYTGEVYDYRM